MRGRFGACTSASPPRVERYESYCVSAVVLAAVGRSSQPFMSMGVGSWASRQDMWKRDLFEAAEPTRKSCGSKLRLHRGQAARFETNGCCVISHCLVREPGLCMRRVLALR